ncbi:MAG: transposase domain-containing protein [Shewanella sp.]
MSQAFFYATRYRFNPRQSVLPEEFIRQYLQDASVATLRRRRLPLESLVMVILGMALYRSMDASLIRCRSCYPFGVRW